MSAAQMTSVELIQSMTGHEESAVETAFGATLEALAANESKLMRALVFVIASRDGKNRKEAKATALDLTRKDLEGYFSDEPEELMPEEPVTESGKG